MCPFPSPCSRTTTAPAPRTSCRCSSRIPTTCRSGSPTASPASIRSCCWCSTVSGWHQMQDRLELLRGLTLMESTTDHHGGSDHHRHRADVDHHRAPPGRARRDRLPDGRRATTCSTCCAGPPRRATPARSIPPESIQHDVAFGGQRPPVVVRAEFRDIGFTRAHLGGCRLVPYRMPSTLVAEIMQPARERGAVRLRLLRRHRQGRPRVRPRLLLRRRARLRRPDGRVPGPGRCPTGAALVITADHGQVDVGDRVFPPAPEVLSHVARQSGEARFRWLHAAPGAAGDAAGGRDRAPRRRGLGGVARADARRGLVRAQGAARPAGPPR